MRFMDLFSKTMLKSSHLQHFIIVNALPPSLNYVQKIVLNYAA